MAAWIFGLLFIFLDLSILVSGFEVGEKLRKR